MKYVFKHGSYIVSFKGRDYKRPTKLAAGMTFTSLRSNHDRTSKLLNKIELIRQHAKDVLDLCSRGTCDDLSKK